MYLSQLIGGYYNPAPLAALHEYNKNKHLDPLDTTSYGIPALQILHSVSATDKPLEERCKVKDVVAAFHCLDFPRTI
jgi:hypothetical protein